MTARRSRSASSSNSNFGCTEIAAAPTERRSEASRDPGRRLLSRPTQTALEHGSHWREAADAVVEQRWSRSCTHRELRIWSIGVGRSRLLLPRDIPPAYHGLLDWYARTWASVTAEDPLLALAARHRRLWKSVDADAYVRGLREAFG